MKPVIFWALCLILLICMLGSCEKEIFDDHSNNQEAEPYGTLHVIFKISHVWLPLDKIVRTDLHIAKNGIEIYKGNYIQSANVTNYQEEYFFYLEPGTYYYEAGIACICEGDSCSAGGFPGNQFGGKFTMDRFTIYKDQVTVVKPTFQ